MLKSKFKWKLIKVILLLIGIVYFSFLYIDIFNREVFISSNLLKYISMVMVYIIPIISGKDALNPRDLKLVQLGLSITMVADFFLLLSGTNYILGLILFSLVQTTYYLRYKAADYMLVFKNRLRVLGLSLGLYGIINISLFKIDFLLVMGLYYGYCLLASVKEGINTLRYGRLPRINGLMIGIGMVLFLLCDINVALFNILNLAGVADRIFFVSMWLFYLPSQVLLSLSVYDYIS